MPKQLMGTLQVASSQLLQQDNHKGLSTQGYVMLLLGFTRICTAVACRFEKVNRHQNALQYKRFNIHQNSGHGLLEACAIDQSVVKSQQRDGAGGSSVEPLKQQLKGQRQQHRWVTRAGVSPEWLEQWCTSAKNQLQYLPPDGLVAVMWALGRLRYHPGSEFLTTVLQQLQLLLPRCSARNLALMMWALMRLQHIPDDRITQQVIQAWEPLIATASKADTQQMCWAIEQLRRWYPVGDLDR